MKTKRKLSLKIAGLMLLLTVLSCCFLGSTFAKYTSATSGSSTVTVAKWQIDGISENGGAKVNTFDFSASKLSPSVDGTPNVLESAKVTITNNSDVDATITLAAGAMTYTKADDSAYADGDNGIAQTALDATFSMSYSAGGTAVSGDLSLAAGASIELTATLTWTTQDDATDTLIGMYIKEVNAAFTLTATQASKLPA